MTSPLGVDLTELSRGVHHFTGFATQATGIRRHARGADLSDGYGNWGLIGKTAGIDERYADVASAVETHTQMIEKFLTDCSINVVGARRSYADADLDSQDSVTAAGAPLSGGIGRDGVGADGVTRWNADTDLPVWADFVAGAGAIDNPDVGALLGAVADLGFNVGTFLADPEAWVLSSLVTVVIDLIQPLEDLLSYVTGNAERISDHAGAWAKVQSELGQLGGDIRHATRADFAHWTGDAGSKARHKLGTFVVGLDDTGKEIGTVSAILTASAAIMQALQALVVTAITELLELVINRLMIGAAAAPITGGASEAAAVTEAAVEAAVKTEQTVAEVSRIAKLLDDVGDLLKTAATTLNDASTIGAPAVMTAGGLVSGGQQWAGGSGKAPAVVSTELAE
ncbi:hypothetical protein Athai_01490 [Actinocatenispora thailandica]|uniref:ESX-1 secretion-associated protein EspA/EspE-like domain-containing protein n=1 Tax=Actinocatenispora thailandica TaxID=227318 RepID=A0A7R7HUN7_9ACTN|nr:hypothetical protein [Actinocatenispora thailandica]BCJ32646.1 hypothetical protein Athai_01490 [Actinocatenispora thailandica]